MMKSLTGLVLLGGTLFGISACNSTSATPAQVGQEVKQQYLATYAQFDKLKAAAVTVCDLELLARIHIGSRFYSDNLAQLNDLHQRYFASEASYNAAYDDAFHATHVEPADLPKTAPQLFEAKQLYCIK